MCRHRACNAMCASLLLVLVPLAAHAQVVISEFLYDAPGADDKQEWVEVFNAGSAAVDLSKWKVNDGSNHVLNAPPKNGGTGSLSLSSGAYLILVDDAMTFIAAHPSLACGVIDTVLALPNASGTVSIMDDSGAVADFFAYAKDMGGAGDGNTLQRSSASGVSFTAAAPTPCSGQLVASGGDAQTGTSNAQAQSYASAQSKSAPVSSYVPPPLPTLFADAGDDRTIIVGADVVLSGRAYLRSKDIVDDHVRYSWNFGDGATAEGESVAHHWEYPGRYAVALIVAQDRNTASDRVIVTAEPAKLSFEALSDGGVEIGNRAGRDLDLSRWIVHGIWQSFTLPSDTTLLSGVSLRLSAKTLGFRADSSTELQYPNGMRALAAGQSAGDTSTTTPSVVPVAAAFTSTAPASFTPSLRTHAPRQNTITPPFDDSAPDAPDSAPASDAVTASTSAQTASAAAAVPVMSPWLWGALGLAGIGGAAGFLAKRAKKYEWDIEDMGETE